jgi:tripartite-type tricarboxylate transporter receptor subunit TctC
MTIHDRRLLSLTATVLGILAAMCGAWAQTYPSRPVTMIVPYPPGGPTDAAGRIMAERMRVSLGQPVIIENVAGANGSIGTGKVARASGDGYTFGLGPWNTHVSNVALYALPYDVSNDFEPVALFVRYALLLAAKKTIAANDLSELIVWLKANKASLGSAGVGSVGHVSSFLLQKMTGATLQHVPYRGSAPAMQDLVAGQVDVMIDAPVVVLPQVGAHSIKAFAVAAKSRLSVAPEIPTVDEAGLPGFYVSNWFGFWVPKGTPKSVIGRLNGAVVDTLADAAVVQRLGDVGFEIFPREQQTPEALAALHKAELGKWLPIIRAANIKGE